MTGDSMAAALLLTRQAETPLSEIQFHAQTAAGLDLSDLELRQAFFQSCRFSDCDLSCAAFYLSLIHI